MISNFIAFIESPKSGIRQGFILLIILISLIVFTRSRAETIATIKTANSEGFGSETKGGEGGEICSVTNLNDAGKGSFRDCVTKMGARIVIFKIGGTITVDSQITIENPYLTVAGHTAPGDGITLKINPVLNDGNILRIETHHVILRGLSLRPGPHAVGTYLNRALSIGKGAHHIIADHLTLSWATDTVLNLWGSCSDITVSNSIIAEGLFNSTHIDEGATSPSPHSMGFMIGGGCTRVSAYNNILAHNKNRMPLFTSGQADFANNVIYNFNWPVANIVTRLAPDNPETSVNLIGNTWISRGKFNTTNKPIIVDGNGDTASVYVKNNQFSYDLGNTSGVTDFVSLKAGGKLLSNPLQIPNKHTYQSAPEAYQYTLANAGNSYALLCDGTKSPRRDAHDNRIIKNIQQHTGDFIDHPNQVGGWLNIASGVPCLDTDNDNLPDLWEKRFFGSLTAQANNDNDNDGYTNIEEYLNFTDPGVLSGGGGQEPAPNQAPQITNIAGQTSIIAIPVALQIQASDPEGKALTYVATNLPAGLQLNATNGMITGNPSKIATYNVTITVTDPQNKSKSMSFNWYILEAPNNGGGSGGGALPGGNTPTVTRLILVNADTDLDIMELKNGSIINVKDLPSRNLNVRAETNPQVPTKSVRFGLNSNSNYRTESSEPFSIQGDNNGDYAAWRPELGVYTLSVTPYSDKNAGGVKGNALIIFFELHDGPSNGGNPSNLPPQIQNTNNQAHLINTPVSLQIQASDPEGKALKYSAVGLPPGLQINSANGLINGTLTANGNYTVSINVLDPANNTATISFQWTVSSPSNQAPVMTNPGTQTTIMNTQISLQIQASDPEGKGLNYNAMGLPAGLQIDFASGLISGKPTTAGNYLAQVTALDQQGASQKVDFSWNITASPVITPAPTSGNLAVTALTLINADTNMDMMALTNGATLNLQSLPTKNLNIRAEVSGNVKSVKFDLNKGQYKNTEDTAPFTLKGDKNGDYLAWTPDPGNYVLVVTPYEKAKASGTVGTSISISFTVTKQAQTVIIAQTNTGSTTPSNTNTNGSAPVQNTSNTNTGASNGSTVVVNGSTTPPNSNSGSAANSGSIAITQLILVNADTNQDIMAVTDGMTINISSLPSKNINIRAEVSGVVASVDFKGKNGLPGRTENEAPYTMAGDSGGNYNSWKVKSGNYTLIVTAFDKVNGQGNSSSPMNINFKLS